MKTTTGQAPATTLRRPTRTVRAAIYVRISQDRTGAGLGVARQEQDCRALCARKGWEVAGLYADNDVSAFSGRPRPQWRRLIADIAAGRVDAIVCWHVDRLTRTPRELEDVIDLLDQRGIDLATVTGEIDLATPTGRLVARTLGAAARHESEHKGERQRRAARQAAEQGQPARSGQRGYGYALDKVTVIEDEAAVIRECARRVLAGESVRGVAADLNARDIRTVSTTPRGGDLPCGGAGAARMSRREHACCVTRTSGLEQQATKGLGRRTLFKSRSRRRAHRHSRFRPLRQTRPSPRSPICSTLLTQRPTSTKR